MFNKGILTAFFFTLTQELLLLLARTVYSQSVVEDSLRQVFVLKSESSNYANL